MGWSTGSTHCSLFGALVQHQVTPLFLPGKFYGQRSLVGFSPWGHPEDTTEHRLRGLTKIVANLGDLLFTNGHKIMQFD